MRFLRWPEQFGARTQGELVRRPVMVGVSVGEQQLADWKGLIRYPEPVGKCIKDGVMLTGDAGVDEDDAVTIPDGVARNNWGAQAPQPMIQLFELDGQRDHSGSVPITHDQRNWSVDRSCSTHGAHNVVLAGFHRCGRARGDIELAQDVFNVPANR